MDFYIALICARFIYMAIKILNKSSGTSFIGMVVLRICPKFLTYCQKYIKNSIITITGTNGKSTTSGLIAHILEQKKNKIIHNLKGANMLTGIANAFALKICPFKKFDNAVIECDEAYLTKLYDYIQANILVVTNLFRDQLDRYGELSTTASFIKNAIDKNPNLTLILNADDPLVTTFGKDRENVLYYGFEDVEFSINSTSKAPTEAFNCTCGHPLSYDKVFFAQEGHYHCPHCGYKRPLLNYQGFAIIKENETLLTVKDTKNNRNYDFELPLVGLYNAYNALAAISQALYEGIEYEIIKTAVKTYKSIFGRAEKRIINGHETLIQLIKNPTGASEVLKTVDLNSNIIIAINDNYADGRDISWLWDSDFECLQNVTKPIITTGTRAKDMAVRLKYAGINTDKIIVEQDIKKAIEFVSNTNDKAEKITILPTYTALLKITKMKG